MQTIFSLSGLVVLPFWLLMIALPLWRVTWRVMQSPWVAAPPAIIYLILVVPRLGDLLPALANASATSVAALLGTETGATIAWAHFVAFDLLVGRWAYLDSRERGIHPLIMVPVLFFTFMLGPIGFLSYLVVREVARLRASAPQATTPATSHA